MHPSTAVNDDGWDKPLMATRSSSYKKRLTKRSIMPPHSPQFPVPSSSRRFFVTRRRISMMMIPLALFSAALFLFFMPFNGSGRSSDSFDLSHTIHEIEVVAEFPHDPKAFTQVRGLVVRHPKSIFRNLSMSKMFFFCVCCVETGTSLCRRWYTLRIYWSIQTGYFDWLSVIIFFHNVILEFDPFCVFFFLFFFSLTVLSQESVSSDRKGMVLMRNIVVKYQTLLLNCQEFVCNCDFGEWYSFILEDKWNIDWNTPMNLNFFCCLWD